MGEGGEGEGVWEGEGEGEGGEGEGREEGEEGGWEHKQVRRKEDRVYRDPSHPDYGKPHKSGGKSKEVKPSRKGYKWKIEDETGKPGEFMIGFRYIMECVGSREFKVVDQRLSSPPRDKIPDHAIGPAAALLQRAEVGAKVRRAQAQMAKRPRKSEALSGDPL